MFNLASFDSVDGTPHAANALLQRLRERSLMARADAHTGDPRLVFAESERPGRICLNVTRWQKASTGARVEILRTALSDLGAIEATGTLRWLYAPVELLSIEFDALVARWQETGEPPIAALIGLDMQASDPATDQRGQTTRGLAALTGFEIEAVGTPFQTEPNVAATILRVARQSLMGFALKDGQAVIERRRIVGHLNQSTAGTFSAGPVYRITFAN